MPDTNMTKIDEIGALEAVRFVAVGYSSTGADQGDREGRGPKQCDLRPRSCQGRVPRRPRDGVTDRDDGCGGSRVLSESLRTASPQIKRQVFEAFDLQIAVDRTEGRVEISATVSEEVAKALNTKDPLAREGLAVVPKDIAGAGFEPATFGL